MKLIKIIGAASIFGLLVYSCASSGPLIKQGTVMDDPSKVCLVAGFINTFSGTMLSDMELETSGGKIPIKGNVRLFAFPNVPLGPFKLSSMVITDGAPMMGITRQFAGKKVRANEGTWYDLENGGSTEIIQGDCKGGFIWAGEFDTSAGTGLKTADTASFPITFKSLPDPDRKPKVIEKLKNEFKGTPWENVIK